MWDWINYLRRPCKKRTFADHYIMDIMLAPVVYLFGLTSYYHITFSFFYWVLVIMRYIILC